FSRSWFVLLHGLRSRGLLLVGRVSRISGVAPRQPFGLALVGDAFSDELVLARLGRFQGIPFALFADHVYSLIFPSRRHLVDHPKCLLHCPRISRPRGATMLYRRILTQGCVNVWKILRCVSKPEATGCVLQRQAGFAPCLLALGTAHLKAATGRGTPGINGTATSPAHSPLKRDADRRAVPAALGTG